MWTIVVLFIFLLFLNLLRKKVYKKKICEQKNEKAVVVTGCDTDIGHELALKFASQSVTVFAACRTRKGIEELEREGKQFKGKVHAFMMKSDTMKVVRKIINISRKYK
ncbi:NAD(P)-binding domain-containing protein [Strongyloides ratti]|uniref:NAD(P)-binding domain-containing protein n=1 Tax=Strongyloides ratti TaxID=34506 RepID=A0A090MTY1_STRRB|nr:NAD(P)-binding domain-containing protein [Strongyloides ratti]CEF61848.1 NAD(P)-binding domain-containing protein [Strongyloides ratti]